ncbi:MAG: tol-pal system protein YbgF [Gammaproteobacteria bacterium]
MKINKIKIRFLILACSSFLGAGVAEAAPPPSEDRAGAAELVRRLDAMQQELRELRGQLEEQQFEIKHLKQQANKQHSTASTPASSAPQHTTQQTQNNHQKPQEMHLDQESLYQRAYGFIRDKNSQEAKTGMQVYLQKYPTGTYAANAYYWLGELEFAEWKKNPEILKTLDEASAHFNQVVQKFPKHAKASDALLKLGLVALGKKDSAQAKHYFKEVGLRYPDSVAAAVATEKMKQL